MVMDLLSGSAAAIRGIGPKRAEALKRLGIRTVADLIGHFPRDYADRRNTKRIAGLAEGEIAAIRGKVDLIVPGPRRYGRVSPLRLLITDDSGSIEAVFFNAAYLAKTISSGSVYTFYGRVAATGGRLQLVHPEIDADSDGNGSGILPLYPLTAGIRQNDMRKWIRLALDLLGAIDETLPQDVILRNKLCGIDQAVRSIHFPENLQKYQEARYRLVFEELFLLQTGLLAARKERSKGSGIAFSPEAAMGGFIETLPFKLTGAQLRVMEEIQRDMESPQKMNRLVQGDVGSGKTIVAAAAIYKAIRSGYQAAMLAPTELLARQHYMTMARLFGRESFNVGFLASSVPASAKKKLLADLKEGRIDLVIGTHAIVQPSVEFRRLGLAVTDEQHRFGVRQRAALSGKGREPDILVMTATPIPRTLAVILYGDLDISVIDEMPKGRKPIITRAIKSGDRVLAYDFILKQIARGRQVYIVAPMIEDSESSDVRSAESLYDEVSRQMHPYRTALLHGEQNQREKEEVMQRFLTGETAVLVSTVVIEVGIDVSNASVMMIENAERFGLAQLHQLRGRVGRGNDQSYCILVSNSDDGVAAERLQTMVSTDDGFIIAEKDLKLRGPGEFFGTRQHGVPELKIADLARHHKVLATVRTESERLLAADPALARPEHAALKSRIAVMFGKMEYFSL